MSFARALPTATALSFCLGNAVWADLTATDVWGDWRDYMQGLGYTVSAVEQVDGNTLGLSNIIVGMTGGPDVESASLRVDSLQFVENADGTVEVVMPDVMPLAITIQPTDTARSSAFTITYTQAGQSMIASGTPEEMIYDYSADTIAMTLDDMTVDGVAYDSDAARFQLDTRDFVSKTAVTTGDTRSYEQSLTMGPTTYDTLFSAPDGPESFGFKTTAQAVTFTGTSDLPVATVQDTSDMNALLAAGFAFDGTFAATETESFIDIEAPEGPSKVKTGSGSTTVTVAMGTTGIVYDVSSTDVQIGAQLAGLPLPLFFEMARTGFDLRAPVVQSETPQDFALGLNMTGFTMSETLWAIFDPNGQLPRDPATLALDLSGKATLTENMLDPEAAGRMAAAGAAPGEISALTIDALTLDAVGARLEATGSATFDNTDKTTVPGFPKPVGSVDIMLEGANGLIDRLVAMGFVPDEQAMGARMMLGLFGVPGNSPDTLSSTIEFNEDGQILANGQRIR
ncbi:DUF2125 domain-containing protein [uncultured Sulfitobacter sp.]|uniref:DUF2125 domain-containing protein n=1 Tax=uncultured Sulfitobacter sp. TaxID=191468 RepID=UPI002638A5E3|nr:DUF2125 domain-containing protein [uncultured Sulfitobacter sp.]